MRILPSRPIYCILYAYTVHFANFACTFCPRASSSGRDMWRSLIALAAAGALPGLAHTAVIRGMVVENQTGHPLARTVVVASPVAGTPGGAKSMRTDLYGGFVFEDLPAGAFLVSAARKGFASVQYGQKQWKSAGLPVILEANQRMQLEIRLPRLGAIAGRVVDENDVGMPDHDVVVYRVAKPPLLVARATIRRPRRISHRQPGTRRVSGAHRDPHVRRGRLSPHVSTATFPPSIKPTRSRLCSISKWRISPSAPCPAVSSNWLVSRACRRCATA